jgi:hypothetical protein
MMSRVFLLLLALMTGLSATQAAAGVRHPQTAGGVAAAVADRVVEADSDQRQHPVADRTTRPDGGIGLVPAAHGAAADPDLPAFPRVTRADRARE